MNPPISYATFVAMLTLSLVPAMVTAQPPANDAPGRGGRGGAPPAVTSPDIAPDRRVTFRLSAPNASAVMVNGEWQGGNRLAMTKDAAGLWSVVTEPIAAEAYF